MNSSEGADLPVAVVNYVVEGVDPVFLGIDPATGAGPELLDLCRAILAALAPRPEEVTLVLAANFVESVKSRLPRSLRGAYSDVRGSGLVAGKTMTVDGGVHVVLPATNFLAPDALIGAVEENERQEFISSLPELERQSRRTVLHEAQHVIMQQESEDDLTFADAPWARRHFLSVAFQVMNEYRAELGVISSFRSDDETQFPIEYLVALRSKLISIDVIYQQDRDVNTLAEHVLNEAMNLWKALAYLSAARRVLGIDSEPIIKEDHRGLWAIMGEAQWNAFEETLRSVVSAHTRTSRGNREDAASGLADVLESWLEQLGYTWKDSEDRETSQFLITSRRLLGS